MSGKPSSEGVRKALFTLQQLRTAEAEIARQRGILEAAQKDLAKAQADRTRAEGDLWGQLTNMDLVSSGNTGFEMRMTYFLRELVTALTPPPWGMPTPAAQPPNPMAPRMPEAPR